jgi:hypothetical protein
VKSTRAPWRWSFTAIVDREQDAFFPATGADDDHLRDAPARVTRPPLRHGGVDVERQPDDEAAGGRQGVPVVLPLREGSPGGSYGTAAEGHVLCPAVFPGGVPLRYQAPVQVAGPGPRRGGAPGPRVGTVVTVSGRGARRPGPRRRRPAHRGRTRAASNAENASGAAGTRSSTGAYG